MSGNVFDMATLRPLEALIRELGGLDECKRLGFVFEDENKIMSLSQVGLSYLLFVKAARRHQRGRGLSMHSQVSRSESRQRVACLTELADPSLSRRGICSVWATYTDERKPYIVNGISSRKCLGASAFGAGPS